jgi:hypothetical protein
MCSLGFQTVTVQRFRGSKKGSRLVKANKNKERHPETFNPFSTSSAAFFVL